MKARVILRILVILSSTLVLIHQGSTQNALNRPAIQGSQEILQTIDQQVDFDSGDFSAEYTITQEKPGQGSSTTRAAVFRRDRDDKFVILILDPVLDRGKGYLKIGNNLWLYDPLARRFTVTSARDRFQNSNAQTSDFFRIRLANDYRVVSRASERLGVYNTQVYELEATHNDVSFPRMKIWVDESNLVRKSEDYSLSGQLIRTTAVPSYQRVGQTYVPVQMVIVDALQGRNIDGRFVNERTTITVAKPSGSSIPDLVFTQAYLERSSR